MRTVNQNEDILGSGFSAQTLALPDDEEGPVVATLVRHSEAVTSRRAVLYVHGFTDYFFQRELAGQFAHAGYRFYALDLRKCGRSIRPHHTPNFCRSVSDYFPDLDAALAELASDGCESVVLHGHSTGGLTTSMYMHERRPEQVNALLLNSPFFEFNANWFIRTVVPRFVNVLARLRPMAVLPVGLGNNYAKSIYRGHHGEWDFRTDWKPIEGFPARAGFLAAVHRAHQQLHNGLDINVPVLVLHSDRSTSAPEWTDDYLQSDGVLNPSQIRKRALALGCNITVISVEKGMHDLILSAKPVRETVYAEYWRWLATYGHATS